MTLKERAKYLLNNGNNVDLVLVENASPLFLQFKAFLDDSMEESDKEAEIILEDVQKQCDKPITNRDLWGNLFKCGYETGNACITKIFLYGNGIRVSNIGKVLHEMYLLTRWQCELDTDRESAQEAAEFFYSKGWDTMMHKFNAYAKRPK